MKGYIILLILVLMQLFAVAQNKYYDVIKLKNGSVIKGIITAKEQDESITILIGGRQSLTFYKDEIASVSKEGRIRFDEKLTFRSKGYFSRNEMGLSFRKNSDWRGSYLTVLPTFQTVHGYQWNQYLETGLGIGTDFYEEALVVPVFMHISGELFQSRLTPFYLIQYGDSFVLNGQQIRVGDTDVKAKQYFKVGGGIQFRNSINAFYISVAFKQNKVDFIDSWIDYYNKETRLYRSVSVGLGMKF